MSFLPPQVQPSADTIRANIHQFFTVQERQIISDLISRGHIDHVGAAVDPSNPERAYWLEQYLILKRPKEEVLDSKVREEMRKYEADGNQIDSPEKAAFWQNRLDLESKGKKLPSLKKALKEAFESKEESEKTVDEESDVQEQTESVNEVPTEDNK